MLSLTTTSEASLPLSDCRFSFLFLHSKLSQRYGWLLDPADFLNQFLRYFLAYRVLDDDDVFGT